MLAFLSGPGLALVAALGNGRGAAPAPAGSVLASEVDSTREIAALVRPPQVAWSFGPLTAEGPPLVQGNTIFVPAREVSGRRIVAGLSLDKGRLLSRTIFPGNEALALSLSGQRLAVRMGTDRVDVHRSNGARLTSERSFSGLGPMSEPLLEDEHLFVRAGESLMAWRLTQREPLWQLDGHALRGSPAAGTTGLFALGYDEENRAHVLWIDRTSGRVRADAVLGQHPDGSRPGLDALVEWRVHARALFVRPSAPLTSTGGEPFPWARLGWSDAGFEPEVRLYDLTAAPLELPEFENGWLAPQTVPSRPGVARVRWILARGAGERTIELASDEHHTWLAEVAAPAARAGSVAYLGATAVALPELTVLWREPTSEMRFAPVPVEAGLLLVDEGGLRLLTEPPGPRSPAQRRATTVVRDIDRRHGERLALFASKRLRAGDAEQARTILDEAEALGADGRAVVRARADIERSGKLRPASDPRLAKALDREELGLRERYPEELAAAVRATVDPDSALALMAELSARCPESAELDELLLASLPPCARVTSANRASWIAFLERRDGLGIELFAPEAGSTPVDAGERRLASERDAWRSDLIGFRSANVFVVSTQDDPGGVARVLEAGELIQRVLGQVFGTLPEAARGDPLGIVLYPTRAEYLDNSPDELDGLEAVLSWTAGHFDAVEDVSRLFLPDEDRRRDRLTAVAAHELTHHWIARRSPLGPPRAALETPGYWIAEAVASWAEELALDPDRGTWSPVNARAASLDTLARTPSGELIPWSRLLQLTAEGARALETGATSRTPLTWQLGRTAERSPLQLFYAQGGALAHWLYRAEGGKYRPLFLRAVREYQRGATFDLLRALGIGPEDLGREVQDFARRALELTGS